MLEEFVRQIEEASLEEAGVASAHRNGQICDAPKNAPQALLATICWSLILIPRACVCIYIHIMCASD